MEHLKLGCYQYLWVESKRDKILFCFLSRDLLIEEIYNSVPEQEELKIQVCLFCWRSCRYCTPMLIHPKQVQQGLTQYVHSVLNLLRLWSYQRTRWYLTKCLCHTDPTSFFSKEIVKETKRLSTKGRKHYWRWTYFNLAVTVYIKRWHSDSKRCWSFSSLSELYTHETE